MTDFLIYLFSALAGLSAIYILFTSNILYAAFSLVVALLSVAALYMLADAHFLAATQIMIYVGGIVVIIIFGVMLTTKLANAPPKSGSHNKFMAFLVCGGLFIILMMSILQINLRALNTEVNSSIQTLGYGLMTDYLLPFELAAVLLLLALIGATVIAGQKRAKE